MFKLRSLITPAMAAAVMVMGASCAVTSESGSMANKSASAAPIEKRSFGMTSDGEAVEQYVLTNGKGASVSLITYGATVTNLIVPDKSGALNDVVLGFDNIRQYQEQSPYFGAIAGRVANRIAKGMFSVGDAHYAVPINNGPNHLHGGFKGYDKRI